MYECDRYAFRKNLMWFGSSIVHIFTCVAVNCLKIMNCQFNHNQICNAEIDDLAK